MRLTLPDLLADEVFGALLVFVRVGAALMLLPGFGEAFVFARLRLVLALLVSAALAGPLAPVLPAWPAEPAVALRLVGGEALLGLFIGAAGRVLFAALHVAGSVIAFQSGLAAAAIFDPSEASQGTLPGRFLSITALVLLFATDGHHLLLRALAASYQGVAPGAAPPPVGDLALLLTRLVGEAFAIGLRVAAPLVLLSLLMYLGMGVITRLMPAFQVFFIALPLQILLAFATLMLALSGGLLVFFAFFEQGMGELTLGG